MIPYPIYLLNGYLLRIRAYLARALIHAAFHCHYDTVRTTHDRYVATQKKRWRAIKKERRS
jgi:hypothetical protein